MSVICCLPQKLPILSCLLFWKMWFEKYWINHLAVQLTQIWCVCLPVELKPAIHNLTISDIAWNGFTASWSPTGGDFDSFIIEVTNMENFAESQNLTLSGNALSLGISGLNPNTSYMVGLYGMHQSAFLEPLYIEATTGTCNLLYCSSTSFFPVKDLCFLFDSTCSVHTWLHETKSR